MKTIEEQPSGDGLMMGLDIHLYLDPAGYLVISSRERPDLTSLDATRDFTLEAPIDEAVTARVEFVVSEVDVDVPLPQVEPERAGLTPEESFWARVRRFLCPRDPEMRCSA